MSSPTTKQIPKVIELNLSDQVFTFTDATGTEWHWNASKGYRLIEQAPREALELHPSDHGIDLVHLRHRYPDLDEQYARTVDLSKPILFLPFHDGTSVLIDGWHRLARCVMEGIPFLPCYELTPQEAQQVLVMKIPPRPKLAPMDTKKGRRKP
ncbi:hypothetical protein [Armatimonas rosea]|uniref:ParB-like nuclease family protein n=1 Tax=Armatimonas rosea TaxID=685828 RepID=A0A7W9SY18_ARMRO|nr:hypothetical protein [Armatimonas rosea]MBB6053954.1 hypothetical protein [Armatimonas rosea]